MISIHPTAVVGADVELGADVQIGPFAIVEEGVRLGDRCHLAGHVVIKRGCTLGSENGIHEGAVSGCGGQHVAAPADGGNVVIGDGNTIREHSTVHAALRAGDLTRIGNGNYLMVNAHLGHDVVVGNQTIIANNAMLGGHVTVEDFAYISGGVAVHQFCRVGTLVMIGGQAHVVQDAPPYVTIDGLTSRVVGLNRVGLRRRGMPQEEIAQLKEAYRIVFRSGLLWSESLAELRSRFTDGPAKHMHEFLAASERRGFVHERRTPRGAAVKMPAPTTTDAVEEFEVRKVG